MTGEHVPAGVVRAAVCARAAILAQALGALLEDQGVHVVAAVRDVTGLRNVVLRHAPEVLVLVTADGLIGDRDAFAVADDIQRDTGAAVLLLGYHPPPYSTIDRRPTGPTRIAHLDMERLEAHQLGRAVRQVVAGEVLADLSWVPSPARGEWADGVLSTQEYRVWTLLADGLSNLGIAVALGITEGTVEKHCSSVLAKLNLDLDPHVSRRVLAALRFRSGRTGRASFPG
jgi:DNA-binding NarL/FixJ family response regulator